MAAIPGIHYGQPQPVMHMVGQPQPVMMHGAPVATHMAGQPMVVSHGAPMVVSHAAPVMMAPPVMAPSGHGVIRPLEPGHPLHSHPDYQPRVVSAEQRAAHPHEHAQYMGAVPGQPMTTNYHAQWGTNLMAAPVNYHGIAPTVQAAAYQSVLPWQEDHGGPKTQERQALFHECDKNGNGFCSLAEIDAVLEQKFGGIPHEQKQLMLHCFDSAKNFSGKETGHQSDYIEFAEFRVFLEMLANSGM